MTECRPIGRLRHLAISRERAAPLYSLPTDERAASASARARCRASIFHYAPLKVGRVMIHSAIVYSYIEHHDAIVYIHIVSDDY